MSDSPNDLNNEERTTVNIRRAPKFSAFVIVGALLGFLVALVLTSLFPADPAVGFGASLGLFSLFGIALGGIVGAAIAVAVDRRASRRSMKVIAGKLAVRVEEEPFHSDDSATEDSASTSNA